MAYQKNWPTLLAYTVAVIVFFIAAVYAVMYATGYRIDFESWALQKTGVLAITTKPSGATVTLNDNQSVRKTPFTLRNALPGPYHIKLTLEGYQPYEKDVEVISSQATEEHNVDLVLNNLKLTTVSDQITAILNIESDIWAFNRNQQFIKIGNPSTPLGFDKMPTNVKTVLTQATGLYLAKKYPNSNDIALGVIVGNKRWLVIADPLGYRGQLFGAPLNQVSTEKLFWIDADRLMMLIGNSLYTLDLNLNQTNLYSKGVSGITYENGKAYYITRDTKGQVILYSDGNLFDDKPAEVVFDKVPVANSHGIMVTPQETIIVLADNRSGQGLWLIDKNPETKASEYQLTKLASGIFGTLYDYLNDQIFFVQDKEVDVYDILKRTTQKLRQFMDTPILVGKRNESLFVQSQNKFWIGDPTLSNVYEITNTTNTTLFLGPDSKQVWTLTDGQLNNWTLRNSDQGIFGVLPNWVGTLSG